MANINKNNTINYIELPMVKNAETKKFYHQAFEWEFTDWGPDYISFSEANIDGGFKWNGRCANIQSRYPRCCLCKRP